jgi:hypothetical protein
MGILRMPARGPGGSSYHQVNFVAQRLVFLAATSSIELPTKYRSRPGLLRYDVLMSALCKDALAETDAKPGQGASVGRT